MEMLRRMYGIAEPVRQSMELKIVRDTTWRPAVLGDSLPSVHEDVLKGTDTTISWEDVFSGEEMRIIPGFHDEMERKLRI
jgi:proteasome maturation protein